MIFISRKANHFPTLAVESYPSVEASPPFFALHDHTHSLPPDRGHSITAPAFRKIVHQVEDGCRGILIVDDLGIRSIAGIIENKSPSDAQNAAREASFTQTPPGHIHFVNSLVTGLPVPRDPIEAAIVLKPVPIHRKHGSRPTP
jgi:hypothetical protein